MNGNPRRPELMQNSKLPPLERLPINVANSQQLETGNIVSTPNPTLFKRTLSTNLFARLRSSFRSQRLRSSVEGVDEFYEEGAPNLPSFRVTGSSLDDDVLIVDWTASVWACVRGSCLGQMTPAGLPDWTALGMGKSGHWLFLWVRYGWGSLALLISLAAVFAGDISRAIDPDSDGP